MSKKKVAMLEIGDLWIVTEEAAAMANELGVPLENLVTDQKLASHIDLVMLQYFFDNNGAILKRVPYDGEVYIHGKVKISYSGLPYSTYRSLFFKESSEE